MRIVTAGPNDDASPTSHVGAVSSPFAKTASPATSSMPAERRRADDARVATRPGPPVGRMPERAAARRARTTIRPRDPERRVDDPRRRAGPGARPRLEGHVGRDRHQREQDERDDREDDARAGEPGRRAVPPSKATPVRSTPTVATVAPSAWSGRQRLAAEDDRQDDRQPAVRGDHAADHRDRPDLEAREVRRGTRRPRSARAGPAARAPSGRSGASRRCATKITRNRTAVTDCTPASTRRLPIPGWRARTRCPSCPRPGRAGVRSAVRWASAEPSGARPDLVLPFGTGPPSADEARPSVGM